MERHDAYYRQYVQILREELRPATGCTEPIAIAYAAAKARSVLGALPDRVLVEVSGNIIKNVKSVVVPHTGGLRGIPAAAAAGIVAGDAEAQLEVLSGMTEAQSAAISPFLKVVPVEVRHADTPYIFDIQVTVFHGPDSAQVRLVGHHTNVVSVRRGGQVLLEREISEGSGSLTDRSCLTVEGIVAFADCLSTEDVEEVLEQQIRCNMAIAEEGLRHDYGANIGKTLLRGHEEDLSYRMRAYAAAASDARMNGCEMPVVINSGSGNQGITSSVPVIVCARATGRSHEELLRALAVANLVTIHLKTGIGRLSAYCGAVSAGCGAAAGLAYLQGGDYDTVAHTVVNTVAMDSGIICQLRRQDRSRRGRRAAGAGHVSQRQPVLWRRRHREKGRGEHHRQRGPAGPTGHGADGQADHSADDGELTTAVGQPYAYRAGTQVVPACLLFVSGGILFAGSFSVLPPAACKRRKSPPHGRNILFPTHMVGKI